jgi:hypothetical protein
MQNTKMTTQFRVPLQTSALLAGVLLTPMAGIAAVLGAWRLSADPGWTSGFFVKEGLLSRYQFWFAAAVSAQTAAILLKRWAQSRPEAPRALVPADL